MDLSATSSTEPHRISALVIAGPTASGKSALALALAERFGGVIINADSQQRYGALPILTAQPSAADQARAPHRLFADLAPEQSGSAADWSAHAAAEIERARAEGKVPILAGGTGLYLRALMQGLADIPKAPAAVRARVRALLEELGNAQFHARLVARDPEAARLATGDTQRLIRAFEVLEATGVSLYAWQRRSTQPPAAARYFKILLLPPRDDLYAVCDTRFRSMIKAGALAEVGTLREQGIGPEAPIMKVLGARPLMAHLAGALDLETAIGLAQTATRQYAKRQVTWFRHQFAADLRVDGFYSDQILSDIAAQASVFLTRI